MKRPPMQMAFCIGGYILIFVADTLENIRDDFQRRNTPGPLDFIDYVLCYDDGHVACRLRSGKLPLFSFTG